MHPRHDQDIIFRMSGLPPLRLPVCYDELAPPEEVLDLHKADFFYKEDPDEVPAVISESPLTSLVKYWREATDSNVVIAAPMAAQNIPVPRIFTAPKTPPAPFPSFAKYATSLPPRPLFDHEIIAEPRDEMQRPFSQVSLPVFEDDILLNLTELQQLEAVESEISPEVFDVL